MDERDYSVLLSKFDKEFFIFDLHFLTCKKCAAIVLKSEISARRHDDWHWDLKRRVIN